MSKVNSNSLSSPSSTSYYNCHNNERESECPAHKMPVVCNRVVASELRVYGRNYSVATICN